MSSALFAPPTSAPADNQWLFWSRNPEQFYRHHDLAIAFKHGQYLTADPREAELLLGFEKDSHGREVKCLMRPRATAPEPVVTSSRRKRARAVPATV